MADLLIPQTEANRLIAAEKVRRDKKHYAFHSPGERLNIPLVSIDQSDNFHLDITRGRVKAVKCSFQNRSQSTIILIRLCLHGSPHRNPDGTEVPSSHIHIYREGYGDAWAYDLLSLPSEIPVNQKVVFSNIENLYNTLEDFNALCNITKPPFIDPTIFS